MSLLIDELMLECKRKGIKITQKDSVEAAGIGQTAIHTSYSWRYAGTEAADPCDDLPIALRRCSVEKLRSMT